MGRGDIVGTVVKQQTMNNKSILLRVHFQLVMRRRWILLSNWLIGFSGEGDSLEDEQVIIFYFIFG